MAATAWSFYSSFKVAMADGTHDLDANEFRITLHTSAASANVMNNELSTFASIANEVASGNGYSTSGFTLVTRSWISAATGVVKFDAGDPSWTAAGGTIADIKYAVISTGSHVVCHSTLSSNQFTLADGSSLTVQFAASGIFELSG